MILSWAMLALTAMLMLFLAAGVWSALALNEWWERSRYGNPVPHVPDVGPYELAASRIRPEILAEIERHRDARRLEYTLNVPADSANWIMEVR